MSWPALGWASKQRPGRVADKMVLIALADRHNEETELSYPSIAWLAEFSCLDRKTVVAAISRLEAMGLIADSGERVGKTKQVKAYRLAYKDTEKGVPETEPLEANSTAFSGKESQKRDTEPVLEPVCPTDATHPPARACAKTRIPANWLPCDLPETVLALTNQWPPGRADRELEGFRDYWLTRPKDFHRDNWDRVWWNRIRDIHDRVMRDNRYAKPPCDNEEPRNAFARVVSRRQADLAAAGTG